MRKKIGKRYLCAAAVLFMAFSSVGCAKLEMMPLTDEEKALCVEYAANTVLKHDKNNIDRMRYVEPSTQAPVEADTQQQTQTQSQTNGGDGADQTVMAQTYTSMNEIFGLAGLDIQPAGYEVTNSYPSGGEEMGMSMVAVKGYKLLVMKFQITNTTQGDIPLNLLGANAAYKGVINGSVRLNAQVTALLNGFNTYNSIIPAGGAKELVLVFQVNENDTNNISSVELNVTYNDKQGTVVMN